MQYEEFLHFIWENQFFGKDRLVTTCGRRLHIVTPGTPHFHAGPDFFNSRIRFGSMVLAGNVEIHLRASDWEKHSHHLDPAYNNVILHVVRESDSLTFTHSGKLVPQLELSFPVPVHRLFLSLQGNRSWLACRQHIGQISPILFRSWLTVMGRQRLRDKGIHIGQLYRSAGFSWEQCLRLALSSAFGLPVNSLPFEMTVRSVPPGIIRTFRDDPVILEAMLFGQAGFLCPDGGTGPYHRQLARAHADLSGHLPHSGVKHHLWKFLRIRPAAFPTVRLAQFASLLHRHRGLHEAFLEAGSIAECEQLLNVRAGEYWNNHYHFGKCAPWAEKYLGHQGRIQILINAVIPFLINFGRNRRDDALVSRGIGMIQEIDAERNHILSSWASAGIMAQDAFESQALIQLYQHYCRQKRCLECRIGIRLFKDTVDE